MGALHAAATAPWVHSLALLCLCAAYLQGGWYKALNFRGADLIGIENIQQNQLGIGLRNSGKRMLRAQKLIQVALIEIMLHRAFNQLMGSQPLAGNWRAVQHLLLVKQHGQLLQGIVI